MHWLLGNIIVVSRCVSCRTPHVSLGLAVTTPGVVIDLDPSNPPEIPDTLVQTPSVKGIGEVPTTQVLSWKKFVPYG